LGLGAPAVLAALIAWLAVPRLVSALFLLPGDAAIDLVEAGIRPSEAGIFRAIEAQGQSLRYLPQADPHLRTAYLALSLAESSSLPAAEESELIEGRQLPSGPGPDLVTRPASRLVHVGRAAAQGR
jgi:hypothetical protein